MSTRSFHSLFMVASCAGAALGCYLVSLRVASERAALEAVETKIVAAQRDMRVLQTEIGTRGRLAQLERWNVKVLALSAPTADQFLQGGFELARLTKPDVKPDFDAAVVLAAAPAPDSAKPEIGQRGNDDSGVRQSDQPRSLLHQASLKTETREVPANTVAGQGSGAPRPAVKKSTGQPVTAAKPARRPPVDTPGLAAAKAAAKPPSKAAAKISVDKVQSTAAKPVTKPVRIAKSDPLAPLTETRAAKPTKE
jgi:hypothetical protein